MTNILRTVTDWIQIRLPTSLLWVRLVFVALGFTCIGIAGNAVVLSEVVPPISITSADGPQRIPISRLWTPSFLSLDGWDDDGTFYYRVRLLEKHVVERGVQADYVARGIALFWLAVLSFVSAAYFTFRYAWSSGIFDAFSRYVFITLFPSALVTIVLFQPDPMNNFLAWKGEHPSRRVLERQLKGFPDLPPLLDLPRQ